VLHFKFGKFSLELSIGFKSSVLCPSVIQETFIAHQKLLVQQLSNDYDIGRKKRGKQTLLP
jgi:hypothetical protein